MGEASILSEKLRRYGAVGVGIIPDSLATIRYLEAAKATQPSAPTGYPKEEKVATTNGGSFTRAEILTLLDETIRVQGIVQAEISQLARDLAKELKEKSEGKKKKKTIPIPEALRKIKELHLPRDPLEERNLTEEAFQKLVAEYEEDEEVAAKAQLLLHPEPKGDVTRARCISVEKIIEIHQFMVARMQKVLAEFLVLDQETRRSFSHKACETTAELLVSIAVEQLGVHCEDVEQAVIWHEDVLGNHPEFARCTEQLASMMQHLTGSAQPRPEKADFLEALRTMAEHSQKAKELFISSFPVYEDYRAKNCSAAEAYRRFEDFNTSTPAGKEGLEDMSPVELQLCYDEYREDAEVQHWWTKAGVENSLMMAASVQSLMKSGGATASSPPEDKTDKKGKKIKPSEIVEMQELMVDEMKRLCEACREAAKASSKAWKADIAMQMVQALASASVERRYGCSPEEMTMAGLQNAPTLQKNERFVRATEKQQEIIMTVATFCPESN